MKFILLAFSLSLSLSNEHLSVNVSLPIIQELEILHVDDLPIISAEDINKGYIDIKDAVTINIKSNVRWKLNVLTDKKSLYTSKEVDISNIKILKNGILMNIGESPVVIFEGMQTSGEIVNVSYRRILSWDTCPPGAWSIEPKFMLEPLQ